MARSAADELRTVRDLVRFGTSGFNAAKLSYGHGTDNAFDEAVYLTLWALQLPLDKLDPFLDARLTRAEIRHVLTIFERRVQTRLPAPYLTHEAWQLGCKFYVDERVLIPRSFIGELLEQQLAPWVQAPAAVGNVLDLCTGSGVIAIQAAHAFEGAKVDALDISAGALEVAAHNVADYGLQNRVRLLQSDVFSALKKQRYDIILSNPPYVNTASMAALPAEFTHEPALALAGGADGMDVVRRILQGAATHLKRHGLLVLEIGHERAHFEAAFPKLAVTWLSVSAGDEQVLLCTQEALKETFS
jgi:ribosomal protein L3 glutamine methyltransferase